jgi:tetratricopeptide (TPR) repeat protein
MARWIKSRAAKILMGLGIVIGGTTIWASLHPDNIFLKPWRMEQTTLSANIMLGPYPVKSDFRQLKKDGVTTIISLLDSRLPYESILLAEEKENAKRYGMQVQNFPMASLFGQKMGSDYYNTAEAAAQAAAAASKQGVAYIHCYLGMHRAKDVETYLAKLALSTEHVDYADKQSERQQDTIALDQANIAFLEKRYQDSLKELKNIQHKTSQAATLEAWNNYQLGNNQIALEGFSKVAAEMPYSQDAHVGLGYSALRINNLELAEQQFSMLFAKYPNDPSVIEGLGYVRFRQNNLPEAKLLFEKAVVLDPENIEMRDTLAKIQGKPLPPPKTQ